MKYAIIAAGDGSRLASEGVEDPKPLVRINGEMLIDRLIRIFVENGAEEIVVICNDKMPSVSEHLADVKENKLGICGVPLRYVVKSTPSSMHSMFEISEYLEGSPFCLTTVDTVFKESEFADYVESLQIGIATGEMDGLMAVTDYIDDEKPLYVSTNEQMEITGFHDTECNCKFISGGIYGLSAKSLVTLRHCVERGESRMRNFQRALVSDGMRLKAFRFSKILDVDHKEDIAKAESFVQS